jgi:hypothetical protein
MGVNKSSGGGRAWYPSGPKLDGSSSSSCTYSSSTTYAPTRDARNPDPMNFTIEKSQQVADIFVTMIRYPNCTNYEGRKIVVTDFNPKRRQTLDPHFAEGSGLIARFVPTDEGWTMACNFAKTICR